jgi:hypothetical protein
VIIQASEDNYFLIMQRPCHEKEFIAASGVHPKSYAADLMSRIYCCLFNGVTHINAEYKKYYAVEYKTIWHFLFWHYSINHSVIEKVRKAYDPSKGLFYGNVDTGGDYGVGQYIMSEEGFPFVEKILKTALKEKVK